jgi:hypothetical protein
MTPFSKRDKKKWGLLGLLIVFVITLGALITTYRIKYLYRADSYKTFTESDIPESNSSPNLSKVSQIFFVLENKIFVKTDPLELTEKEVEALEQLLNLESSDPILQNSEKLRIIKEISRDLLYASRAYVSIQNSLVSFDISMLSSEDIKTFKTFSERKVTCFLKIRKDLERHILGKPSAIPKILKEPHILGSLLQNQGYPKMDYRLDAPFEAELIKSYPNFINSYEILLKPQADLNELIHTFLLAEQYTLQHNYQLRSAVSNFILNLRENFGSVCHYKLMHNPNDLLNLFKEDLAIYLGSKLEPIIENFIQTDLIPHKYVSLL